MFRFSRRELFKLGLAGGTGLACSAFDHGSGCGSSSGSTLVSSSGFLSPPVRPWVEPLVIPQVLQPTTLYPAFQASEPARDWWGPYVHQRYAEFPAKKSYQIDVQNVNWSFHRDLPPAAMFGYGGTVPGPMIKARYGEPIVVRIHNMLHKIQYGVGMPDTATHLHNMHSPAESDGFPGDFVTPGYYRDQHYPMIRAGYDKSPSTNGDYRETLNTLWYHDHRFNFTSQNVYKGLFGFFNAFDELDSGNENDPNPSALRLPSGQFDIMLGFQDPQFDNSGNIFFDVFDTDGHLGDKIAVNGKILPYLNVARRQYRFRLLDGGPSRFYQFFLSKGLPLTANQTWVPMMLVANDGNLLEAPIQTDNVLLGVANRMDIVVDFSQFKDGDTVYLVNRLEQTSGRGPTYNLMNPGVPVLQFRVSGSVPDAPKVTPNKKLRPLPRPSTGELATAVRRQFIFDRRNGAWTVNGNIADISSPTVSPKQGTCEIWTIANNSGSWSHPVHIHFEEFQILSRNGVPPPNYEVCRKDVMVLHPNEFIQCFFRFRDFLGHYVMHCHNVVHEDHAMMIRWDIVK
jgi:FtsP/CotA-like multicopper oxidase with cupredoxin domain